MMPRLPFSGVSHLRGIDSVALLAKRLSQQPASNWTVVGDSQAHPAAARWAARHGLQGTEFAKLGDLRRTFAALHAVDPCPGWNDDLERWTVVQSKALRFDEEPMTVEIDRLSVIDNYAWQLDVGTGTVWPFQLTFTAASRDSLLLRALAERHLRCR